MDFWLKLQARPKVIQDFILVLPESLENCLLVILLYLGAATAVVSQSPSFLGLELFLPLQAVLFNFSLSCFGLLQPLVSCGPWVLSGQSASLPIAAAGFLVTCHIAGDSEAKLSRHFKWTGFAP